jgi:hypothetical protein
MMNTEPQDELIRVGRPMKRVKLTFEPTSPLDGSVTDGPLIQVGRPLERVNLMFEPVVSIYLELTLSLRPETDKTSVSAIFEKLTVLVDLFNDYEAELGGVGFTVDATRSGVKAGPTIGLVLVPNDPNGAERRLAKVAELLAKAASEYPDKAEVSVGVFSVTDPNQPLFSVAA